MRLAIISPTYNALSESFVKAHRTLFDDCLYYYGGTFPSRLSGEGWFMGGWKDGMYDCLAFKLKNPHAFKYPKSFSLKEILLCESFKSHGVTHVLAEFGNCAVRVMDICSFMGIKLISHFHGYDISVTQTVKENEDLYRKLFDVSEYIIAVSRLMERKLISMGCAPSKIIYNPCGPNDMFETCSPNLECNDILYVGRFVEKKAPYDLLLAFNDVVKKKPGAHLHMVGNGPLLECCKQLATYLNIDNNITFYGAMDHENMFEMYSKVAIYAQPSVTALSGDQEGTPVSVMEASLSSLPVVATKHAGIPDVIIDGETGLLVDEHDINSLSNAIITLMNDKKLCKEMGQKGREFISKNFKLSISLDRIRQLMV